MIIDILGKFFVEGWAALYRRRIRRCLNFCGKNLGIRYDTKFHNPQYISIGDDFRVSERVKIDVWDKYKQQCFCPMVKIGSGVSMNSDCYLSAIGKITIGNGVMMGRNVFITDHSHGETRLYDMAPEERELFSKGEVVIGNNVWIGSNVCIFSGVTIGNNCIIGANTVVTHSIPENSMVGGNPARVIKNLY